MIQLLKSRGYTLIELLVGMAIILAVGTIVFSIFISTLRGTNKSATLDTIRQNGSYAINQISRSIRNAKSFEGVSVNGIDTFTRSCLVEDGEGSLPRYHAVSIQTFNNITEVYRCPLNGEIGIYRNNTPLINTESVMIQPGSCYFTCVQAASSEVPTIGIHFVTQNRIQTGSPDSDSQIPFRTTVSPRNFAR